MHIVVIFGLVSVLEMLWIILNRKKIEEILEHLVTKPIKEEFKDSPICVVFATMLRAFHPHIWAAALATVLGNISMSAVIFILIGLIIENI